MCYTLCTAVVILQLALCVIRIVTRPHASQPDMPTRPHTPDRLSRSRPTSQLTNPLTSRHASTSAHPLASSPTHLPCTSQHARRVPDTPASTRTPGTPGALRTDTGYTRFLPHYHISTTGAQQPRGDAYRVSCGFRHPLSDATRATLRALTPVPHITYSKICYTPVRAVLCALRAISHTVSGVRTYCQLPRNTGHAPCRTVI